MAMTLRLSAGEDATLARLARAFQSSKNQAVATAIEIAAPKPDHPEFVRATTERLLTTHAALLTRLAEA